MPIDFDSVWNTVVAQCPRATSWIHGLDHWRRVERNALLIAQFTGSNVEVVRLFAHFHDSRRQNDFWDRGHGRRGAEFASTLRGTVFELADSEFELLHHACVWHADGKLHDDPTIGVCWDADRLDLGRVGTIPSPKYMSTEIGRKIALADSVEAFIRASQPSTNGADG